MTDHPPLPRDLRELDGDAATEAAAADTASAEAVAAAKRAARPWPAPAPLGAPPPASPFPVEALPGWMRAMVRAIADVLQVAPDLAAAMMLPVLGAALAKRVVVAPSDGWTEHPSLYVMALARAGESKSAVMNALLAPVTTAEAEERARMAEVVRRARTDRDLAAAEVERVRKAVTAGRATRPELDAAEDALAALPLVTSPRYLLGGDATPEALAAVLAEQGERLLVAAAEGGGIDTMTGLRYGDGGANLDLMLRAHGGEPVTIDRVSREPVRLDAPVLSVALCVQPDVFTAAVAKPGFAARGLVGRFLLAWPESRVGSRDMALRPWPARVRELYAAAMADLWTLPAVDRPAVVPFDREAVDLFVNWRGEVERESAPGGAYAASDALTAAAGKLSGACARIALILHCAERLDCGEAPIGGTINSATLHRAINVTDYFGAHAARAYATAARSDDPDDAAMVDARALLATLKRRAQNGPLGLVSRADLLNMRNGGTAARTDAAVEVLVAHGWLRPVHDPPRGGRGRPPSPRCEVHPAVSGIPPMVQPVSPTSRRQFPDAKNTENAVESQRTDMTDAPPPVSAVTSPGVVAGEGTDTWNL